jgi:hypothetical protein
LFTWDVGMQPPNDRPHEKLRTFGFFPQSAPMLRKPVRRLKHGETARPICETLYFLSRKNWFVTPMAFVTT